MPEGHTIHRLAAEHRRLLRGEVRAESPQGRFAVGAQRLDGATFTGAEAHGKHLFHRYRLAGGERSWLHVHLGLYGWFSNGPLPAPAPVGQIRLRLRSERAWLDLRGPIACELYTQADKKALHARLGADPLRADADPEAAGERLRRSRTPVGLLLTNQEILSGVGNVYRAEVLFRHGIDPYRPGRGITGQEWRSIWDDLVALMADGVKRGRIDTVHVEHTPEAMGRPPRVDRHGGEVYVYRRADQPCLVCGTPVRTAELAARNLFWCPTCQPV